MSHFTLGVVNVGGGESRGGECRTIFCRETLKYGTFCREKLDSRCEPKNVKFSQRADSIFYAALPPFLKQLLMQKHKRALNDISLYCFFCN